MSAPVDVDKRRLIQKKSTTRCHFVWSSLEWSFSKVVWLVERRLTAGTIER